MQVVWERGSKKSFIPTILSSFPPHLCGQHGRVHQVTAATLQHQHVYTQLPHRVAHDAQALWIGEGGVLRG